VKASEPGGTPVSAPEQDAYELTVNTSTAGMGGDDPFADLPLEPAGFAAGQTVVDLVYGEHPSRLLAAATATGAGVVDGIEILVRQGANSLKIWTGLEPALDAMRTAARLPD
jgi:shikimate dehydrogenase